MDEESEGGDTEELMDEDSDTEELIDEDDDTEELMDEVRAIATEAIERCLDGRQAVDRMHLKNCVKDDLSKFLYAKTKRKPMVLPVIMNV